MNRALVILPLAAVLVAAAWPASPAQPAARGDAPSLCEQMTQAKLLENPGLASEWNQAIRSGDAAEIARMKDLFAKIRSAHGCDGEVALPETQAPAAPRLPPGHPPIAPGERPPHGMSFEAPAVVTI